MTPSRQRRTAPGFTLVEIVAVLAVFLTILAFIFPRFAGLRHRTYSDVVANDLRNLVQAQEELFAKEGRYATDLEDPGLVFKWHDKVAIMITEVVPNNSWIATGEYISWPDAYCAVAVGDFIPPGYVGHRVECLVP
mgnify:CR=1 FL=1